MAKGHLRSALMLYDRDAQCDRLKHLPVVTAVTDGSHAARIESSHECKLDVCLVGVPDNDQPERQAGELLSRSAERIGGDDMDLQRSGELMQDRRHSPQQLAVHGERPVEVQDQVFEAQVPETRNVDGQHRGPSPHNGDGADGVRDDAVRHGAHQPTSECVLAPMTQHDVVGIPAVGMIQNLLRGMPG